MFRGCRLLTSSDEESSGSDNDRGEEEEDDVFVWVEDTTWILEHEQIEGSRGNGQFPNCQS